MQCSTIKSQNKKRQQCFKLQWNVIFRVKTLVRGESYFQGAGYFQNMGDLSLRGAGIFSHIIHFLWGVKCKVY